MGDHNLVMQGAVFLDMGDRKIMTEAEAIGEFGPELRHPDGSAMSDSAALIDVMRAAKKRTYLVPMTIGVVEGE